MVGRAKEEFAELIAHLHSVLFSEYDGILQLSWQLSLVSKALSH
jgi:hypothetical protein